MIKRLKRHIIIVNMLLVGIVIISIFATVCVNNYSNSASELEHGLNQVVDKYGKGFGKFNNFENSNEINEPPDTNFKKKPDIRDNAPMQISSYVVVDIDQNGTIVNIQENNVTIDEADLKDCVELIKKSNKMSGQLADYGLMYVKRDDIAHCKIAFASNSEIYSNLQKTIFISAGLFVGSMIVIFLISLGLSGLAVKPVKEAWEKQKQFVANASHELKTPLTVILANNNIMMSHTDSFENERKWLESTEEEAQHMKQLIDQMLFLAKSDAGENRVQFNDVNFSEIVEGSSLNFEPVAFEKNVVINAEIVPDITLNGNSLQLNQLAHILIDNAVKYSDSNSAVKISLKKRGDTVEFAVNNIGSVISNDDIEHIFDRFYRAEKSRTTKGYGLGLSIAQNIVHNMNGKLSVQSNEIDGTTFTATFKA